MIYSYVLLIVPTLALVVPLARRPTIGECVFGGLLAVQGLGMLPFRLGGFAADITPFLVALGCWILLVVGAKRGADYGTLAGVDG